MTWYHGSPIQLEYLLAGSTITRDEHLARVFSHKPTIVSQENTADGSILWIRHNGVLPGYLFVIDEPVADDDVDPHPRTTMLPGQEWLTRRRLRVRLVARVAVVPEEFLTPEAVEELMRRARD